MDYDPGCSYFMLCSFQPEHPLKLCKVGYIGKKHRAWWCWWGVVKLGHELCVAGFDYGKIGPSAFL